MGWSSASGISWGQRSSLADPRNSDQGGSEFRHEEVAALLGTREIAALGGMAVLLPLRAGFFLCRGFWFQFAYVGETSLKIFCELLRIA